MASDLARYITWYYAHLMTASEAAALYHLIMTSKATRGRTDLAAQAEAARRGYPRLSRDPAVLELAREGLDAFMERTAQRILANHSTEIFLNTCTKCGALKRTPVARPCRHCKSWDEPIIPEEQRNCIPPYLLANGR